MFASDMKEIHTIEGLDFIVFKREKRGNITRPLAPGVYLICTKIKGRLKIRYVGSTGDFRHRLTSHHAINNLIYEGVIESQIRIMFLEIRTYRNQISEVEQCLINKIRPSHNRIVRFDNNLKVTELKAFIQKSVSEYAYMLKKNKIKN